MERDEVQEKYPLIANILRAITPYNLDCIGMYTSKIERAGSREKLEQWVRYWAKVDIKQSVLILNRLVRTSDEEIADLKNIVINEINSKTNEKEKYYELLVAFLYFKDFKTVANIYDFLDFVIHKKTYSVIETNDENINIYLNSLYEKFENYISIFSEEEKNKYFDELNNLRKIKDFKSSQLIETFYDNRNDFRLKRNSTKNRRY